MYTADTSCSEYPKRLACLNISLAEAERGKGCSILSPIDNDSLKSFCMCVKAKCVGKPPSMIAEKKRVRICS